MSASILVSLSFRATHAPASAFRGLPVKVRRRGSDWGMGPGRRRLAKVTQCAALANAARRHSTLVVLTIGPEVVLLALLLRILAPRTTLVCADPLLADRAPARLCWAYRLVDHFVVIRRRDVRLLEAGFGVPAHRCSFVHWPVDAWEPTTDAAAEPYLYSAGWAQRDWETLLSALRDVPVRAVLAGEVGPHGRRQHGRAVLDVIGPIPEHEGRALLQGCTLMVLPLLDNGRPAGPLVLLDAMSAGRPVVATRTDGIADYVRDGRDAVLVPPGDAEAMAVAIGRLLGDEAERHRLGEAARVATADWTPEAFWLHCLECAVVRR